MATKATLWNGKPASTSTFPDSCRVKGYDKTGTKYSNVLPSNMMNRNGRADKALAVMCKNGSTGSGIWGYRLDRAGCGYGQVAGTCDCGNELSVSIKCGEFHD